MTVTARAVNSRLAGVFDDGDLANVQPYFEDEASRIVARTREQLGVAESGETIGKYKYLARPNRKDKSVEHDETSAVLPVAGAFQAKVVGKKSMHTLQEWEGYVSSVEASGFEAVLCDMTDRSRKNERAVIPFDALDSEELAHLKIGAIFRMVVGFAVTEHGNRVNDHVIYFRRYSPRQDPKREKFSDLVRSLA